MALETISASNQVSGTSLSKSKTYIIKKKTYNGTSHNFSMHKFQTYWKIERIINKYVCTDSYIKND